MNTNLLRSGLSELTLISLQELSSIAKALGLNLILEEKIDLISYSKKGQIASTHRYEYSDEDIKQLEERLYTMATKRRQKWESEFRLLIPTLEKLPKAFLTFGPAQATLENGDGTCTLYTYDEHGLRAFTSDIANAMLAQACDQLKAAGGPGEQGIAMRTICGNCHPTSGCENCDSNRQFPHKGQCNHNCGACHATSSEQGTNQPAGQCQSCAECYNSHCEKNPNLIILLWDTLSPDQQRLFSASLPPEAQEKLGAALHSNRNTPEGASNR